VRHWLSGDGVEPLALGVLFFASAFVLLAYGLKFIRKVEELGI
jgi:hypothetical protein